ncbi:MAG TPA: hypothetical protein VFQ91_26025 [Bryobacteraceae bacterium]|nr:hypothetical protein [Bryobacteraceae bacterium]
MRRAMSGILLYFATSVLSGQIAYRIQTLAGSSYAGDGGPATQALLQQAEGVAIHTDGTIYIADAATHRIRAVSSTGEIRTVAGDGSPGFDGDGGPAAQAHLRTPYGLALDRQGNLYVADLGNARVRVVGTDGRIRTVAGGGELPASDAVEGSLATTLQFKTPRNVLADGSGGFYFSDFDGHRVYAVDYRGIVTVFAGTGNPGYGADNVAANRSALRNPAGLAVEPQGGIVVVESGSQRLRRIARGIATAYLTDALRNYPLYSPTGIAFDTAGNLYIADARATGSLKRSPQGEVTALAVSGRAVAADPRGGVYYAATAAIYRVDLTNKVTLAAGATGALAAWTGDGGAADSARLQAPSAVAYDRNGNLYIADEQAHRVRMVSPAGIITTIAGTGTAAYAGDGGAANKASLHTPRGLAFDGNGFLYIADSGNHAVRKISPDGLITTAAGNGFAGALGDGGPARAARLHSPSGVAVDPRGDVYIADTANHRVRRITSNGLLANYAGNGSPGLAFEGSAAVVAQLNEPRGLAFDAAGNLYIADSGNNRIRRVDITGLLTTISEPAFSTPAGVAVSPAGAIFVADTGKHRICQITDSGVLSIAGGETSGFRGDGGFANEALLQSPAGLAFDSQGNLAVADMDNNRVRQLRATPLVISVLEDGPRVFNAASSAETPFVAGMLATLIGEGIGPAQAAEGKPTAAGWPSTLGEVEVFIDGEAAPLLYVSSGQINLQVPALTSGRTKVYLEIFYRGSLRSKSQVAVTAAAPGVFAQIVNENGSLNSATNPAARGSIVVIFATGAGTLGADTYAVKIGGMAAELLWAGPMPGVPGITQINLRLPSGFFAPGGHAVSLRTGQTDSPEGRFLYIQ